ncbi:TatD family hydrolase [Viscerimonas tarda]
MDLYDIHTHDSAPSTEEGEEGRPYILNVYPLGFEDAKDNAACCFFSCGVHPWYSENAEPQLNFLEEIAGDHRIVAIGEAGYDKLKGPGLATQRIAFERQIELSEQLGKPLIVHCVKAWDELLASKKKFKPRQPWIIHGYRGNTELTKELLAHGFRFSIGEKFNKNFVKEVPLDSLFCETDTFDATIEEVYADLAEALGISPEDLAAQIEKNVMNVFPQLVAVGVS